MNPLNVITRISASAAADAIINPMSDTPDVGRSRLPFSLPQDAPHIGRPGDDGLRPSRGDRASLANPGRQVICISGDAPYR
jgi:hypothetical protein